MAENDDVQDKPAVIFQGGNGWKVSTHRRHGFVSTPESSYQTTISPALVERPRSPFTKIERYKPKPQIIRNDSYGSDGDGSGTDVVIVKRSATVSPLVPVQHRISPINNHHQNVVEELKEERVNEQLTAISMDPVDKEHFEPASMIETAQEPITYILEKRFQKEEGPADENRKKNKNINNASTQWTWWSGFAFAITCCIPNYILLKVGRKKTRLIQQAWREKIALCLVILLFCMGLAFFTFGMKFALCPHERITNPYSYTTDQGSTNLTWRSDVLVYGKLYPFDVMSQFLSTQHNVNMTLDFQGANLSPLFNPDPEGKCQSFVGSSSSNNEANKCIVENAYEPTMPLFVPPTNSCISISDLTSWYSAEYYLEYSWQDLVLDKAQLHLLVLSDTVLDIQPYLNANETIFGAHMDVLLRETVGKDATYLLSTSDDAKDAWSCLATQYAAGVISSDTMGCIVYEIVIDVFLAIVLALMMSRYVMALVFHWLVSPSLTRPGGRSRGILAWRSIAGGNQFSMKDHRPSNSSLTDTLASAPLSPSSNEATNTDPRHTILFVTCYSEGEESIKSTLDSLVNTSYSPQHKLLFIVVDGIITGAGNNRPTSEICRDLLTLVDCAKDEEEPACEYEAVADQEKRINRAQVYIGHYKSTPALLVIKCGNASETHKPGNRGKRDSQMILMSFFQKVIFYDLFTQLDYEIFYKMRKIMSNKRITPDKFELVLMVDADTQVFPDSITHMVAAMNNDITLMGVCGETKVANKRESWVTSIQVFEYFISHHYAKSFESIFGGVTCLPGCFSMYRIKAPKHGGWIPILANPDIIQQFNTIGVNTLHAKNLLLLGEDRFLSTLMLKVFPRRQMIFVPQAKCKTVVPCSFSVLLSQRRRWINSTCHNLMELALVSDLCGIACLSMQFVVVIDLISSTVLPAAVLLLVFFFIDMGMTGSPQYQPLFIFLATLLLPAILILLTAKKLSYIRWMAIYLLAMPIWNFVLPIYSFWHFDDFTWGETRKVDTNTNNQGHIEEQKTNNEVMTTGIIHEKLWHVWEKERLALKDTVPKRKRKIPVPAAIVPLPILAQPLISPPPISPPTLTLQPPSSLPLDYNISPISSLVQQQQYIRNSVGSNYYYVSPPPLNMYPTRHSIPLNPHFSMAYYPPPPNSNLHNTNAQFYYNNF